MLVSLFPVTVTVQCSLIETRRVDGKVWLEHVARLCTIEIPPSIADRAAFWGELHQRRGKLSNRFGSETHGKLIGQSMLASRCRRLMRSGRQRSGRCRQANVDTIRRRTSGGSSLKLLPEFGGQLCGLERRQWPGTWRGGERVTRCLGTTLEARSAYLR
jgi:hypothetical protein